MVCSKQTTWKISYRHHKTFPAKAVDRVFWTYTLKYEIIFGNSYKGTDSEEHITATRSQSLRVSEAVFGMIYLWTIQLTKR